jgi:hypothetical protein
MFSHWNFASSLRWYIICPSCGYSHDWDDESCRNWKLEVLRNYASGKKLEVVINPEILTTAQYRVKTGPLSIRPELLYWRKIRWFAEMSGIYRHYSQKTNLMEQTRKDLIASGPEAIANYQYGGEVELIEIEKIEGSSKSGNNMGEKVGPSP